MRNTFRRLVYRGLMQIGTLVQTLTDRALEKDNIKKILVIGIGEIGDILRLFPFFRALRECFPGTTVTILTTLPAHHEVWSLLPESLSPDERVFFDLEGQHRNVRTKIRLFYRLRRKKFDLTIDTSRGHGMIPNSVMSFLIGSRQRIGFQMDGAGFLHTVKVRFHEDEYIGAQNLRLLEAGGRLHSSPNIMIELPAIGWPGAHDIVDFKTPVVAVHPGARWNGFQRCWPPGNYAKVARIIIEEYDATIVLLGDASEREIVGKIAADIGHSNVRDMAGGTSLAEAALIIKQSLLFLGNDSSLLHIAVALGTPSVGIFGPTSPRQVMPDVRNFTAVSADLPCHPCYTHQPLFDIECFHRECLTNLSVDKVMFSVRAMMRMNLTRLNSRLTLKKGERACFENRR